MRYAVHLEIEAEDDIAAWQRANDLAEQAGAAGWLTTAEDWSEHIASPDASS